MRCVNAFLGADMRLGHDGLLAYAKSKKVDLNALGAGEAAVFINAKRTHMKIYSAKVISFVRSVDINRPIDLSVLDYIAKIWDSDALFDYPQALKEVLTLKLESKKSQKLKPEHLSSTTAKAILTKSL